MTTVATELIHLLPPDYPSVQLSDRISKNFDRRSTLYVILNSPTPSANEQAAKDIETYLEKNELVDYVNIEKMGYDFLDENKLMLVDFESVQKIRDNLKDRIHQQKLGGLYVNFEDSTSEQKQNGGFEDAVKKYKDKFTQGVDSRYRRNADGTVYVVDVFPKNPDTGLSFFKTFGDAIDRDMQKFDLKKYDPQMEFGYAGGIKSRVDQYNALIKDLQVGGTVSMVSIFIVFYFYFARFIKKRRTGFLNHVRLVLTRIVPVIIVFIPMIFSTLIAFCFCSFFFTQLNVVTSFLFTIIFGLGVDIGIHLVTRYIQDRKKGVSLEDVHQNMVQRTGKSCATSVLTTVFSFYILTVNDFKGFSDFGWIAGNGLIIALLCYLIFQPCLVLLIERYHLLGRDIFQTPVLPQTSRKKNIPFAKPLLIACGALTLFSIFYVHNVSFEWNFDKLKMKIAEREHQRSLLTTTIGRVNSPGVYMVDSKEEALAVTHELRHRKEQDKESPTIDYVFSYYDVVPENQDEKIALWRDIAKLLQDDALQATLNPDDKKLADDLMVAVDKIKPIRAEDVPPELVKTFWGKNQPGAGPSVEFVMPLSDLQLDNGINAKEFYKDVSRVDALGKTFFAASDGLVFAQVLLTLFHDSKVAVVLSTAILSLLIALHYRNFKKTAFVLFCLSCGMLWMFVTMALFGLKLNFYNMIIIPAMIGMGEDNSVHVLDRFEEMGRSSMFDVLRTSGGAAFMASVATILGYAGLCFAHHPGLNSIGWMAIIGLATCLLASLVLLPLMAQAFLKPKPEN